MAKSGKGRIVSVNSAPDIRSRFGDLVDTGGTRHYVGVRFLGETHYWHNVPAGRYHVDQEVPVTLKDNGVLVLNRIEGE